MNTSRRRSRLSSVLFLALSTATVASLAKAHARVVSTEPAADSTVSAPASVQVHFNEAVAAKMSSVKLTANDGTPVGVMSMNSAKDPATLSVMPKAPLGAGHYTVTWSAVSEDGHKTQGTFGFTVQ